MPHLEITEVLLVPCNIFNYNYQQNLRVLYIFVPDKSFSQLLDVSLKKFEFFKMFNSEFLYTKVLFTDQNFKPLETEDKRNITLVIN